MMLRILQQYYPIRNVVFLLGEGLTIYFSVIIATWLVTGNVMSTQIIFNRKAVLITLICLICLYYNDLYDLQITNNLSELMIRLLQSLGVSSIFLAGIFYVYPGTIVSPRAYIFSIVFVVLFVFAWRITYHFILENGIFSQKIALMGSGDLAKTIYQEISQKKDCGYDLKLHILEPGPEQDIGEIKGIENIHLHDGQNLNANIAKLNIKKVIVALKEKRNNFPLKDLLDCRVSGVDVIDGNSFYETLTGKLSVEQINPGWLIYSDGFKHSFAKRVLKRLLDIAVSLVMLILLMPLIVLLMIIIKIDSRGATIFSQERVGGKRRPYKIYKFRSMIDNAEKQSGPKWAEDSDPRVTRVGTFIRKWRLDELPQLWNVLKGDMSFVGPRPERAFFINELEKKIPYYGKRFTVKPGLTGWAQVSYGYGSSVEDAIEKLNYELFYIKNMSILLDLIIILRTVKTVLFGRGAR